MFNAYIIFTILMYHHFLNHQFLLDHFFATINSSAVDILIQVSLPVLCLFS